MNNLIKKVAEKHMTTKKEVTVEIQEAIRIAMNTKDNTHFSKEFWDNLKLNEKNPDIESFIIACAKLLS